MILKSQIAILLIVHSLLSFVCSNWWSCNLTWFSIFTWSNFFSIILKVLEELNDLLAAESEAVETALPDVPTEELPEPETGEPAAVAAAPQKTKTKQAMLASW